MRNLKDSSVLLSLCFLISACQSTKDFKLTTFHESGQSAADDLHVIQVNSNRVRQKCLFFNAEAENNWRHQYFMYILNDKNEVLEIMASTNQDRETCHSQMHEIEKILQSEPQVRVCVRDELEKITQYSDQNGFVQFGSLGTHKIIYGSLTFDSICSSKKCVSRNSVYVDTCPGFVKQRADDTD
jgi:hypothetical protein